MQHNRLLFNSKLLTGIIIFLVTQTVYAQANINLAGCTDNLFVLGKDNNTISTVGKSYSPKCLRIKVGSTVTIDASSHHPLAAMANINNKINPFNSQQSFETPQTRVMNEAGTYGYFCEAHGDNSGKGMAGVIIVE